jgi:hypothetical protein
VTAKKAATSAKHAATKKHAASAKHTETKAQLAHLHVLHVEHEAHLAHLAATGKSVTVKATPAKPAKATKAVAFGIGDHLPVCAFEAVAQSLRLAGARVHEDDAGELWHLLGEPADGVPVGEALAAAALFGLAGYRPEPLLVPEAIEGDCELLRSDLEVCRPLLGYAAGDVIGQMRFNKEVHGLILGIDRPGPHAVLATADGWWSWGELYDPWAARVDEAWAVSWS